MKDSHQNFIHSIFPLIVFLLSPPTHLSLLSTSVYDCVVTESKERYFSVLSLRYIYLHRRKISFPLPFHLQPLSGVGVNATWKYNFWCEWKSFFSRYLSHTYAVSPEHILLFYLYFASTPIINFSDKKVNFPRVFHPFGFLFHVLNYLEANLNFYLEKQTKNKKENVGTQHAFYIFMTLFWFSSGKFWKAFVEDNFLQDFYDFSFTAWQKERNRQEMEWNENFPANFFMLFSIECVRSILLLLIPFHTWASIVY